MSVIFERTNLAGLTFVISFISISPLMTSVINKSGNDHTQKN